MRDDKAAPETKGITVKLLGVVDLGPEIEGMAGRQLRMRVVTIEPGGVFGPVHDHRDRPGMFYEVRRDVIAAYAAELIRRVAPTAHT